MSALSSLGQIPLRTIALLAGVFFAGAATGAGVLRLVGPPPHRLHASALGPYGELDLSPEQHARVRQILEAHRGELDAIMREGMPKVRAVQDLIEKDLRQVLSPEQVRKLEQMRARGHRPPPHGMPGMLPPPGPLPGGPLPALPPEPPEPGN